MGRSAYIGRKNEIPKHTVVEYIESVSGNEQYIDSGVYATNNTKIAAWAEWTTGSGYPMLCGAYESAANQFAVFYNSSNWKAWFGSSSVAFSSAYTGKKMVSMDKTNFVVGDTSKAISSGSFKATIPLYIFALHQDGVAQHHGSLKLYAMKVYEGDELIRDFVPVRDEDGVACLYDKVGKKHYYNAGQGEFAAPMAGHTEVEYIQSTGTQHIDTGFKPNQDTRVLMEAEFPLTAQSDAVFLFGSRATSTTLRFQFANNNGNAYRTDYNSTPSAFEAGISFAEKFTIDKNGNVTTLAEKYSVTHTKATFACTYSLYLFATNGTGTATGRVSAKIYSCKIYDSGTLVRDYIPVVDHNGEACLYDQLNHVYYRNAGTGRFSSGPAKNVKLPEGYKRLSYVESTGAQYIDTAVPYSSTEKITMTAKVEYTTVSPTNQLMGFSGNSGFGIGTAAAKWWEISNPSSVSAGVVYDIEYTKNGANNSRTINGATTSGTNSNHSYGGNLYLFAVADTVTNPVPSCFCYMKMYEAKVFVNDEMVREYVPCVCGDVVGLYDLVGDVFYENDGGGVFAAGSVMETGGDQPEYVARLWKNIFVEVDNVARRGRKGWVGVNGVARPFMGDYELAYYGSVEPISVAKGWVGSASFGGLALCFGGQDVNFQKNTKIEGYDETLTRKVVGDLTYATAAPTGSVLDDTIQIKTKGVYVEAYTEEFTKVGTGDAGLDSVLQGGSVGDYVVYPGFETSNGSYIYTTNALTKDLIRKAAANRPTTGGGSAVAETENHAIWVVGGNTSVSLGRAFAYDGDLVATDLEADVIGKGEDRCGCSMDGFALFAGGYGKQGTGGTNDPRAEIKTVFGWDDDLVRAVAEDLLRANSNMSSAYSKGYAVFSGGGYNMPYYDKAEVYDGDLTNCGAIGLAESRRLHGSAAVGNYILIFGGEQSEEMVYLNSAEALKFV